MISNLVTFDDVWPRVIATLRASDPLPDAALPVYFVRDLQGQVTVSVSQAVEDRTEACEALERLAARLADSLGAHARPAGATVLYVSDGLLNTLSATRTGIEGFPGVYRAERLMIGGGWWTVSAPWEVPHPLRCTLFSIEGGVGRSTTLAFLARHLARAGERVLVVDLDLESPGLSPALLEPQRCARFGVTDWFTEELAGQGHRVVEDMVAAPAWAQECDGEVAVAAAHGANPGEYLAKLGRVYVANRDASWTQRLSKLLGELEKAATPTITLIESRSGLHDIAAATVTDLDAEVLLFASGADGGWLDYDMLFRHWNRQQLSRQIRDRLAVVAALAPQDGREAHMREFRMRAWDLFRNHLYDAVDDRDGPAECVSGSSDLEEIFYFDLQDRHAPHAPLEINWTRGLASGAPVMKLEESILLSAYGRFVEPFANRLLTRRTEAGA